MLVKKTCRIALTKMKYCRGKENIFSLSHLQSDFLLVHCGNVIGMDMKAGIEDVNIVALLQDVREGENYSQTESSQSSLCSE